MMRKPLKKVPKSKKYNRILTISDMHIPYHHPDAIEFLRYLKKKHRPDLVVCLGDMADFHAISFHDSDPDLDSAGMELERLQKIVAILEKIFPEMYIIGSNHGDLPLRKLFAHGLPISFLRPYNDIYDVGTGWKFVDELTLPQNGNPIYFVHGLSKNGLNVVKQRALNVVQGHFHTDFKIDYVSNPAHLLFSMQVGCLINTKSLAFAYNKLQLQRPIIGTGVIIDGKPILEPMELDDTGRWVGRKK